MASFVSALDRPNAKAGQPPDTVQATARLRDCVRLLRHVDTIKFNGMARNWDAKKCFVLLVTVKDDEVDMTQAARLSVVRPTAPFQIERTAKDFQKLEKAMRQWCSKQHSTTTTDPKCALCDPIASGSATAAAVTKSTKSGGIFGSLFQGNSNKLETAEEWTRWLNASIASARQVDVDDPDAATTTAAAAAPSLCEGAHHVPALLARFLLQEFASDVIF